MTPKESLRALKKNEYISKWYRSTTKHKTNSNVNHINTCRKEIRNIIKKNKGYQHSMDYNHSITQTLFNIYNNHSSHSSNTDDITINLMMKACILFNHSRNIFEKPFWNDITNRINHPQHNISYTLLIKSCIKAHQFEKGKQLISSLHLTTSQDPYVQTVLMDFYGHFGDVMTAKLIFDCIPQNEKDAVCIGSMMKVFITNDLTEHALILYDEYRHITNEICDLLAIKACMKTHNVDKGKAMHEIIKSKQNSECISVSLATTLIDFYGTFGDIDAAIHIFDAVDNNQKDVWCIGSMMEAFYNNKEYEQCFELFANMQSLNRKIRPNLACFSIVFKNCTQTTAYYIGKEIHEKLKVDKYNQWILKDIQIQTKLIKFYGKCGDINVCEQIFEEIKRDQYSEYECDIAIWNAMVTAFGRNGEIEKVKQLYNMLKKNEKIYNNIDRKFYILLINACSHCNHAILAKEIWNNDIESDNIKYDSYVVTSIVDCFARKGWIEEAKNIISQYQNYKKKHKITIMGHDNDRTMWMCLLSGAKNTKNIELAKAIYHEMHTQFKDITHKELNAVSPSFFDEDKLDELSKKNNLF